MRIIGKAGTSARKVQAVASGALSTGDTVIVNADGTVSVIVETVVTQAVGTPAVFESAQVDHPYVTYDASSQKIVIAYSDAGNSSYGTAVVGTVSDTSISFGTPVVFESANITNISSTCDVNAGKVVIFYSDVGNNGYGTAVVGTVSGTSISFGSPVVFEIAGTTNISATYEANAQKVVVSYRDGGNSNYGTAIVGTVSGTTISFGSPVVFESALSASMSAVFDASSGKVVISYLDFGNGSYGTSTVGTVSGTSISFGTPVVFESASTEYISAAYDTANQKVVIAYHDNGNSSYGTSIVGTVSGTSISFGSPVVFESADSRYISATYDATAQKVVVGYSDFGNLEHGTVIVGSVTGNSITFESPVVFESAGSYNVTAVYDVAAQRAVIAYKDLGNLQYGTSVVFRNAYTSTTLTSENFIGISTGGYADTQAATINAKGFVDDNQSGLTAGQSYYVQTDGTLSTTAGDPEVFAGTAVSANKLIVKG